MLKIYAAVAIGVIAIADTVSPIGQQPIWKQAADDAFYQDPAVIAARRKQEEIAAAESRERGRRLRMTYEGYKISRQMQSQTHVIKNQFRTIAGGIDNSTAVPTSEERLQRAKEARKRFSPTNPAWMFQNR